MEDVFVYPEDNLQETLSRVSPGSVIHLGEGLYHCKTEITIPGITLVGQDAESTIICFDDYAKKLHKDGKEYNTFRTYTLAVLADHVTMRSLSIRNDALDPSEKGQEVALTVYGDDFHMEKCHLFSTQDTLFLGPLPPDLILRYDGFLKDPLRQSRYLSQQFHHCLIEGSVDFIFGCGHALFKECEIRSVFDGRNVGYVAAPAHSQEQTEGFLFQDCTFTCDDQVPDQSIYLARPWRDHGLSRFENCTYDRHISPAGFDPWLDSGRDKTARFFETPPVPGRVSWINKA